MRNPCLHRLDLRYRYVTTCGATTPTTSQNHDRALRVDDVGLSAATRRQPRDCAYTNRNFGTVLHILIYCANNTALIAGIVAGGFLYQRAAVRSSRPIDPSCSLQT